MLIICRTKYVRIPPLKFYHLPPKPPPPKQVPTHPHAKLTPLPPTIYIVLPSFGPGEISLSFA